MIRPLRGHVCQRLMVVSNWIPGSPHAQAAPAIASQIARAFTVRTTAPDVTARMLHGPSSFTAAMKASVTRTELFEFCPLTVR